MKLLIFSLLICATTCAIAGDSRQRERHQQFSLPEDGGEAFVFDWQGGAWQYDNIHGEFRIVITQSAELSANKLYLQWWRDIEGGKELGYSLGVVELNETPAFTFNKAECVTSACNQIRIQAKHRFEGFQQTINLEILSLGRYKINL